MTSSACRDAPNASTHPGAHLQSTPLVSRGTVCRRSTSLKHDGRRPDPPSLGPRRTYWTSVSISVYMASAASEGLIRSWSTSSWYR